MAVKLSLNFRPNSKGANMSYSFYPKDFTFVSTELHAFQDKLAEFEKRDTVVIGVSTDTEFSHWGWLQVPKGEGGIKGVSYPLL